MLLECLKALQVSFDAEPFSDLLVDLLKEQTSNSGNWTGEVFARQAPDLIDKGASDEDWVGCRSNFKGIIFSKKNVSIHFICLYTQLLA